MAIADIKDMDDNNTDEDTSNDTNDDLQTSDEDNSDETQPEGEPDTDSPSDDSPSTDDSNQQADEAGEASAETDDDSGDSEDVDINDVDDPDNLPDDKRAEYYKRKFSNSTAEAQRLQQELEDATSFNSEDEPDDEELADQFPNYHDLSEVEQDRIKRQVATERKVNRIENALADVTEQNQRMSEAQEFARESDSIQDEQAFAGYVAESDDSANLETLEKSYLYEVGGDGSEPDQGDTGSNSSKDPALNTGGNSQAVSTSDSDTITSSEATELRKNDPDTYRKEVVEGDVEIVPDE